jgi:CP family cyanate transporter-like MFS transporter
MQINTYADEVSRVAARVRPVWVLLGLLALAPNLRTALAGYPPVLPSARDELGVSAAVAGLAQSGAVLMMAVGSLVGAAPGERWGRERALAGAVGLVAAGSLVRWWPSPVTLVGGGLLIGLGVGVAGTLLAGVVKEHLPGQAGLVTGAYVVAMAVGVTVAGGAAIPLASALGGWPASLAFWAVPAVLAIAVWLPVAHRAGGGSGSAARTRVVLPWRDRFAWLAGAYLAGSSLLVYGWQTWLAPYYRDLGWSPHAAGLLLAVWGFVQIPAALAAPALAGRRRRWRFWAGLTLLPAAVGTVGAMLAPDSAAWLWAVLIGLGGAGFPLGLAVIIWRTPDGAASAATSGLAMGIGYTAAGLGPVLMGFLVDATGGYRAAIAVLLGAVVVQAVAIARISDPPRTSGGSGAAP